ncbi:MAG: sensor histidine kinase [Acidimicrobiia bacterium]
MTRRLFVAFLAVAAAVLFVCDLLGRDQVVNAERRRSVIALERQAFKVALSAQDNLEQDLDDVGRAQIRVVAGDIAHRSHAIAVVTDRAGRVVVVRPTSADAAIAAFAGDAATRTMRRSTAVASTARVRGVDYEVAQVPISANQGIVGAVVLMARSEVLDTAAHDRLAFLTPTFLAALLASALGAWVLARVLTRPLGQLVAATRRVARDVTDPPEVEPRGPAELRELADAFNAMSLRVRDTVDRQSRFASDVSHQLRTPLTTIKVALDNLEAQIAAADGASASESLAGATAEAERMQQLIEGLLVLTRAGSGELAREAVDVALVSRERVEHWRALAAESGIEISLLAPAAVGALAVRGALDQIVDNLVDNALTAAPTGSAIEVVLTRGPRDVTLMVRDHGQGLSETDRLRAFDRFWRGRDAAGVGLGIGLTIVRDLVDVCGGDIVLEATPGGGLQAVVTLEPAALDDTMPGGPAGSSESPLRQRLGRYLRARDPGRALALEATVWREFTAGSAGLAGPDAATRVFTLARSRMEEHSTAAEAVDDEADALLLRTVGELEPYEVAAVMGVTSAAVPRLLRRARRTIRRASGSTRGRSRSGKVGALAFGLVVAGAGTAAATGSLPAPMQRGMARLLDGVGVEIPSAPSEGTAVDHGRPDEPGPASRGRGEAGTAGGVETTLPGAGLPVASGDEGTGAGAANGAGNGKGSGATPPGPADGNGAGNGSGNGVGNGGNPPGQANGNGNGVGNGGTPPGQANGNGGTPPGQANGVGNGGTPPGQAKQRGPGGLPPGQAKQGGSAATPPGQANGNGVGNGGTPPGQAKQHGSDVAPGQAKKRA